MVVFLGWHLSSALKVGEDLDRGEVVFLGHTVSSPPSSKVWFLGSSQTLESSGGALKERGMLELHPRNSALISLGWGLGIELFLKPRWVQCAVGFANHCFKIIVCLMTETHSQQLPLVFWPVVRMTLWSHPLTSQCLDLVRSSFFLLHLLKAGSAESVLSGLLFHYFITSLKWGIGGPGRCGEARATLPFISHLSRTFCSPPPRTKQQTKRLTTHSHKPYRKLESHPSPISSSLLP